jgi:hypothetical protein
MSKSNLTRARPMRSKSAREASSDIDSLQGGESSPFDSGNIPSTDGILREGGV